MQLVRIYIRHLPSKLIIYKWISKWTTSGQRQLHKGWWWLHMIRGQENKSCLQQKLAEIVIFNGCWEETMHRVRTLHTKQDTGFWLVDSVNQGLWLVNARVHQSCFVEWGVIGNTLVENKEKIKMTLFFQGIQNQQILLVVDNKNVGLKLVFILQRLLYKHWH